MKDRDENLGTIEDVVGTTSHMDHPDLNLVNRYDAIAENAPNSPLPHSRRDFLKVGAGAVATAALAACKPATLVGVAGSTNSDPTANHRLLANWEEVLLRGDLIYGPKLLFIGNAGGYQGYKEHLTYRTLLDKTIGGVDYAVPIGVPIVPDGFGVAIFGVGPHGANYATLLHFQGKPINQKIGIPGKFQTINAHLSDFSDHAKDKKTTNFNVAKRINGVFERDRLLGYSGNTGKSRYKHLHMGIQERDYLGVGDDGKLEMSEWKTPGLDPFKQGIGGGRPTYWDGKTEMDPLVRDNGYERFFKRNANEAFWKLKISSNEELGITDDMKGRLLSIIDRTNIGWEEKHKDFSDYLSQQVLKKQPSKDGEPNYAHLPGSFMYSLALQFIRDKTPAKHRNPDLVITVPFIHPLVVDKYYKANPELTLPGKL